MLRRRKELRFIATAVAYREEPAVEVAYLVVSDDPAGGGRTVDVQRSRHEGTDYERQLGVDGHCLVIDGGLTSDRCVERWAIADAAVVMRLTKAGREELGVTTIRIVVPEEAAAATASALQRLIDDGPEDDDFTVIRTA